MKYFFIFIITLVFFSCQKDDINTKSTLLQMESIKGSVFFLNESSPHAPVKVILRRLSLGNEIDSIQLLKDTVAVTFTDPNGNYVFDQIVPSNDTYAILINLPLDYWHDKWKDETPDGDFLESLDPIFNNYYFIGTKLNADEEDTGNNFYISKNLGTVSGHLYSIRGTEKKPIVNATVWISDRNEQGGAGIYKLGQTKTNQDGYYEINIPKDSKALIQINLSDFPIPINELFARQAIDETPDNDPKTLDNFSLPVDITNNEIDDANNFYFFLKDNYTIVGKVFHDTDKNGTGDIGLGNQTIELYERLNNQPSGNFLQKEKTNAKGEFTFNFLGEAEYILVLKEPNGFKAVKGFDNDQEVGEPSNSNPIYINVNLNKNVPKDSLNYFIVEATDCNQILKLKEYCPPSSTCQFTKDMPIVCLDENNKSVNFFGGHKFKWTNLVNGLMNTGDVFIWNPYEPIKLEVTMANGCEYELFYNRSCPQDLHGGELHLNLIQGGFQPNYSYQTGESVWKFDVFQFKLQITNNITSPVSSNLIPQGNYSYTLKKNSNGKYEMELKSLTNSMTYSLGEIGFENGKITFDDGLAFDGVKRTFVKL